MDGYEVRAHVNSILAVLGELLAEVKGLREDYREERTCYEIGQTPVDFDSIDFGYMLDNVKGNE